MLQLVLESGVLESQCSIRGKCWNRASAVLLFFRFGHRQSPQSSSGTNSKGDCLRISSARLQSSGCWAKAHAMSKEQQKKPSDRKEKYNLNLSQGWPCSRRHSIMSLPRDQFWHCRHVQAGQDCTSSVPWCPLFADLLTPTSALLDCSDS